MGVDILACKQIKKIDCHFNEDGDPIDKNTGKCLDYSEYKQFSKNSYFPGRADEIDDNGVYSYKDSCHFFSAAYSRYNRLRDQLAKVAGYKIGQYELYGQICNSYCVDCWDGKTGPFSELINFSDCEGVIGASVSTKLVKDFYDFQSKAEEENDESFLVFYNSMKSAFEMASENGVVSFH